MIAVETSALMALVLLEPEADRGVADEMAKVALQREAAALKREADELNHQLYARLREIDAERNRMLDDIADRLNLTPALTPLFEARWTLSRKMPP